MTDQPRSRFARRAEQTRGEADHGGHSGDGGDAKVGHAEALRRSMLGLIHKGEPREAHPAYWAPFVVVGEGDTDAALTGAAMTVTNRKRCQPLQKIKSPRRVHRKISELKSLGAGRRIWDVRRQFPRSASTTPIPVQSRVLIGHSVFLGRSEALHYPGKLLALLQRAGGRLDPCCLPTTRPDGTFRRTLANEGSNPHLRRAMEDAMIRTLLVACVAIAGLTGAGAQARADDFPCVSTTFRFIGKNDRVCVSAFDDPKVPGVACHVSQARTGRSQWHDWSRRRPVTVFDCMPSGRSHQRRPGLAYRSGRSVFGAHIHLLQAHPRLPSAGQET